MAKFAIVQSAGQDIGKVRSVHRGWTAASRAQPATFYALVPCDEKTKAGQVRRDLLEHLPWYRARYMTEAA